MGQGAFGQLEIFDLSPSKTKRFTNLSAAGGVGTNNQGISQIFEYHQNVKCPTPIITEGWIQQALPFEINIQFNNPYTDDVRFSINGQPIQDWQRCGTSIDGINYFGPLHPGDTVSLDGFAQCAVSGKCSTWVAQVFYASGSSSYANVFSGGSNAYFQNTGFGSQSPMWHPNGSFGVTEDTSSKSFILGTYLETTTGNSYIGYEESFANLGIPGDFGTPLVEGAGFLNHFKPAKTYDSILSSPTVFDYRAIILQDELLDPALMMESGLRTYDHAWLSYNVSSGFPTQVVSAYAIALFQGITGSGIKFGNQGSELIGNDPQIISGFCQQVSAVIANTGSGCQDPDLPGSFDYCVTGSGQQTLQDALSGISGLMQALGQNVIITLPDVEDFKLSDVAGSYELYTGAIAYNTPSTGDTICFENYVFKDGNTYTGEYSGIFGSVPYWPDINFCLEYPQDYNSIDSLVSALNAKLNIPHEVWYPFDCTFNQLSGYYENTPIMEFTKLDSNTIGFNSILVGAAGNHKWTFTHSGVEEVVGINYLLPGTMIFQGSIDNENWVQLQRTDNIDWSQLGLTSGITNYDYFTSGGHDPSQNPNQTKSGNDTTVSGILKQDIGTLTGSGTTKCGTPFSTTFNLYVPILPTGCTPPSGDQDGGDDGNDNPGPPPADPDQPGSVGWSAYRTGFKFDNEYPYNYYRLILDDLSALPWENQNALSGAFAISNINLYGRVPGDQYVSTGACMIGANYEVQIQSETTGRIQGTVTQHADALTSGLAVWKNYVVEGIPNGNGQVIFQKETGHATEPFKALLNLTLTGVGLATAQTGGFYLYDQVSQSLYPPPIIEGVVTGCGTISGGPYLIVGTPGSPYEIGGPELDSIVSGLSEYVVQTYTFPVTGYIPNVMVPQYNVPAFGYMAGTLTGTAGPADSGYYTFNELIQGVPSSVYSYAVDSYVNASALMIYNNSIASGDKVYINGNSVTYTTDSSKGQPSYFHNLSELLGIINNNPTQFQVTASMYGSNVVELDSLVSGVSGNAITLSNKGTNPPTFNNPTLFGGVTTYQQLSGTSIFQGIAGGRVAAVEHFTNVPASGIGSGYLNYASQIKSFTGTWDLHTGTYYGGSENYEANGWLEGFIFRRPNTAPTILMGTQGSFNVTVNYMGNASASVPDIATLRISGVNFPAYLEFNITGSQ